MGKDEGSVFLRNKNEVAVRLIWTNKEGEEEAWAYNIDVGAYSGGDLTARDLAETMLVATSFINKVVFDKLEELN